MKLKIEDKKRLQKERNVLTAQLSRDRKKIEVELLHKKCYELTQMVNRARNVLSNSKAEISLKLNFLFEGEEMYRGSKRDAGTDDSSCQDLKENLNFEDFANKPGLVTRVIK